MILCLVAWLLFAVAGIPALWRLCERSPTASELWPSDWPEEEE